MTRTALVTGAGSGLGAAVARRLADDGCRVVCTDIDPAAAGSVAAKLPDAVAVAADVRDGDSVAAAVDVAGKDLELVVHAAGVLGYAAALDISRAEWDRVIDTNLTGTFVVLQAAGRVLAAARRGAMVAVASIESHRPPIPGHAHYAAAKAGVLRLTEAFAAELAPQGVRVNAVAPGVIRTPMMAAVLGSGRATTRIEAAVPMGRVGTPAEVAEVCAFLCSDAASFVTGACWSVDGGSLVRSPF